MPGKPRALPPWPSPAGPRPFPFPGVSSSLCAGLCWPVLAEQSLRLCDRPSVLEPFSAGLLAQGGRGQASGGDWMGQSLGEGEQGQRTGACGGCQHFQPDVGK